MFKLLVALSVLLAVNADFGHFNHERFNNGGFNNGGFNNGFGNPVPIQQFNNQRGQSFNNKFTNAGGNAAGAGSATAQEGNVASINQATHNANKFGTSSNAVSANQGSGIGVNVNGAAQADGTFQSGSQRGHQFESNRGIIVRRKRQFDNDYGFGMYGFGRNSGSNANSLGGGSALFGNTFANNFAQTRSGPWGASGMGVGNAGANGVNPSAWNAAMSNSFSAGK